ncbi:hypothetical protein AOX63_05110 [Pseudomonas sp. ADP]|uniref:hypothetical protein n=1 Tax=unclassified Pseudomonas TaxID=196821 RepID=UPI000731CE30|nr:hypothetical protein [Pseudomonas sp. ADPe]KSW22798.1 hypothetical protein AOX63_05110 [Pseudomonas sp. ADP]QOF85730.1 hypothetical protein IG194_03230 [Pseudomonas sp. ADPe]
MLAEERAQIFQIHPHAALESPALVMQAVELGLRLAELALQLLQFGFVIGLAGRDAPGELYGGFRARLCKNARS